MPCSTTPRNSSSPAQYWPRGFCILVNINHLLFLTINFFGAQSLQLSLTAYNFTCLRLTCCITTESMLKTGYEICRVDIFSAALTAASREALSWRTCSSFFVILHFYRAIFVIASSPANSWQIF